MKDTYHLTWQQVAERLTRFHKEEIGTHGLVDLMKLGQYKKLRQKLSATLDELAYPVPEIKYNDEETEWHDVWNVICHVFEEVAPEQSRQDQVSRDALLEFKARLLREIDEMTEE